MNNKPISQIPQCTFSISQNATFRTEMCIFHRNVHISVLNGAWNCEKGQLHFKPMGCNCSSMPSLQLQCLGMPE